VAFWACSVQAAKRSKETGRIVKVFYDIAFNCRALKSYGGALLTLRMLRSAEQRDFAGD
jgi:hypothetical protein